MNWCLAALGCVGRWESSVDAVRCCDSNVCFNVSSSGGEGLGQKFGLGFGAK